MHRAIVGLALIGLVACADTGTTVLVEGSIEDLESRWNDLNPTAEQMSSFTEEHRVGDVVSEPLTIRVQDRNGLSFAHLVVDWTVHDVHGGVSLSGDSVFASTVQSLLDTNGTTSVEWLLGHAAGTQRVSVRVSGPGQNNTKSITTDFELTVLPGEPIELTLNPDAISVEEGENALASVLLEDEYGNEVPEDSYPLVWQTMNSSVADVDEEGIVSAVGRGSTIVTVAAGYMMDSTTVSVTAVPDTTTPPDPPTPTSLQANPSTVTLLELGATRQLSVSARDQYGDPIAAPALSWATADGSIATVSSSGLMTAIGLGTTTVTASAACCSSVEVQVSVQDSTTPPPPPAPADIQANPSAVSLLELGASTQLSVTATDQYGDPIAAPTITWATADGSIATVNSGGLVTSVGVGSTTVTGTADCCSSVQVSVSVQDTTTPPPAPTTLAANPSTVSLLELGASAQLGVTATDQYGDPIATPTITWATADGSIATVSSGGLVTAIGVGSTTVTGTADCCSSVQVSVSVQDTTTPPPAPTTLVAAPSTVSLFELGASAQLGVTATDQYGDPIAAPTITWATADGSIATVNSGGLVTSVGVGSTTVTGTADCCSSVQVSVSVQDTTTPPPPLPPNTPTVNAFPVGPGAGTLQIVSSAFSGNGGSHDATAFQVDAAGGDFSNPQYHDVVLGAELTETVTSLTPGSVVISRVRHRSDNGEWSSWSDSRSTTMSGGPDVHFGSKWERTGNGLSTAEQLAGAWGVVTGQNSGPASRIVDSDAGLVGRGDYFRVNNSGTSSRQVQTDQMVPASTTHWGRVYIRSNNTTSRHNHTIAIGSGSGHPIEFAWGFRGESSGSVPFITISGDINGSYPGVRWWAGDVDNNNNEDQLEVDEWYLVEWQIEYLADPTHYRVAVWIHEADNTGAITLEDKWVTSDFYESDQPGTGRTLAGVQASGDYFGISGGGSPDAARRYSFGNEGPAGGASDSGHMDFASFAISLTGRLRATVLP